jgi:hypothetical protein
MASYIFNFFLEQLFLRIALYSLVSLLSLAEAEAFVGFSCLKSFPP